MTTLTSHPEIPGALGAGSPSLRRILVVDDSDSCRELCAIVLANSGYQVATARNGADALQRLASEEFHLVVTDWEMPVLDGENLVLALREAGRSVPVLFLSGAFATRPLPAAIRREIFAALEKPISIFTLLSAVAAALQVTTAPILETLAG